MGQEFFINSQNLEDKIKSLLPSQGGAGAGVDLSASTQIVPIIDLTESAEGSNLRQDLQTALSLTSVTTFDVINSTQTIVSNTGYFRVFGALTFSSDGSPIAFGNFSLTDGTTSKIIYQIEQGFNTGTNDIGAVNFDFNVFLEAGDSLVCQSSSVAMNITGCTRQLADISGNLVNP